MKFLHLLWRNLTRRKIRTSFTFLSVLVAFFLFGLLMAINTAFDAGIEIAGQNRLLTIHKVSLVQPLPMRYQEQIRGTEGVAEVTHGTWFGGIYQDKKNFFPQIAVDPKPFLDVYPEYVLPEDQRQAWFRTRTGAVAGIKLAERFDWKVGDRIPIQATIWRPRDGGSDIYEFDLVGIYEGTEPSVDETQLFFRHDFLDERMGEMGQVGWYIVEVVDPETSDQVAERIDARFANSPAETKTSTEKAFMQGFAKQIGDTGAILSAIVGIVFFVILLIAGNTMAQSVRERVSELGVLKTLGFTDTAVLGLVLGESMLLSVAAGGLGLGLFGLFQSALRPVVESFLPVFFMPPSAWTIGSACAVGLGLLAGLPPALRAMRLPIVEALREELIVQGLFQVAVVSMINLRSLRQRLGSSAVAVFGFAGVVAVFVAVLSISEGFRHVMQSAGSDDTAIVLRGGSDTELSSGLPLEDTRIIKEAPGVVAASAELFVIVDVPKRSTGTDANVPLRGVEPAAFDVRREVRIVEGRRFEPGRNEVIAGRAAAGQFAGLDVGNQLRWGENTWEVVGIFEADGSVSESEIWTDARVLQPAYRRGSTFQSVYARLESPDAFQTYKDALTSDPRIEVDVERESTYYESQSRVLRQLVNVLGNLIAMLMAIGATFGALNTMYTSVTERRKEIATLRALGFRAVPVVISVLAESMLLAALGGLLGGGVAWLAVNGYQTSTMNWQSFTQVSFQLTVTRELLMGGVVYALLMGFIGGVFPAIRAARLPVAVALRRT